MPISLSDRAINSAAAPPATFFATDTAMAPATPLTPTNAEAQTLATANLLTNTYMDYNGSDTPSINPTYVWFVNNLGTVVPVIAPSGGGGGGLDIMYSAYSPNNIPLVSGRVDLDSANWTEFLDPNSAVNFGTNQITPPSNGTYFISFSATLRGEFQDENGNGALQIQMSGLPSHTVFFEGRSGPDSGNDIYMPGINQICRTLTTANLVSFTFTDTGTAFTMDEFSIQMFKIA